MKHFLLLTAILLFAVIVLHSPSARTQNQEIGLPSVFDFPAAGATCKRKVNLSPWLGMPGVDWPKTFKCVLAVNTCSGVKDYISNPRAAGADMCADYERARRSLLNREICCDGKKPCENPPTNSILSPWFDTGSCGYSQSAGPSLGSQTVDEQNRPLPPGQVWCTATYFICRSSSRLASNMITVSKKVTIDPALQKSNNPGDASEAIANACQSFLDDHRNAPKRSICCDTWEEASDNPQIGSCEPISDPDCDGIPNYQDPFPLHARSTEYISNSPITKFPFWKDFKNAIPGEFCECQWELIDARYKCSNVRVHGSVRRGSSNQAKYHYQAKWNCSATGRQIITTREVTMPGLFCPRGRPNN